jgi:hypothetical protein
MNPSPIPPVEVERGVMTLLFDSISLGMQAQVAPDNDLSTTLSRASIVASTLFIEACANCALDLLALKPRFAGEVDRLSTAGKLDLFLHLRFKGRALDRSRVEYQGYVELKRFRDAFVHPRAQKFDWLEWSEESSESTSPQTNLLRLPTIPAFCGPEVVPTVLQATHRFMAYFFKDLCKMKPSHVTGLLFSRNPVPELKFASIPYWRPHVHAWLAREKVNIDYMRIGTL